MKEEKYTKTLPHWPIHTGYSHHNSIELMKQILMLLGNPHKKLKNIIHVGGTNGKGSTIAFMASILRSAGFSCNVYTSPHIFNFSERFSLNGENAQNEQIFNTLEEIRAICEEYSLQPTVLEASTIAAILLFEKTNADFNIIECCMGGLYDNTNIFDDCNLIYTIITSISFDHMKYLGNTIEEIAFHKAGIQKAGVKSIIAKQKYENAIKLLFNYANKFQIPASFYGEFTIEKLEIESESKTILLYKNFEKEIALPVPSLLGDHQLENVATAICAMLNLKIDEKFIIDGIKNTKWIGRLQRIFNKNFSPLWEVWFDGAHNQGGAKALSDWIISTQSNKKDIIVIGKSKGANQEIFINEFKKCNAEILFVTVAGEILPETGENLQKFAKNIGIDSQNISTIQGLNAYRDEECRIIGCGSLYLMKDFTNF